MQGIQSGRPIEACPSCRKYIPRSSGSLVAKPLTGAGAGLSPAGVAAAFMRMFNHLL
jgi:hypothetical protein